MRGIHRMVDLGDAGARHIGDHGLVDRRNALEAVRAVHALAADPMPRIDFDAFDLRHSPPADQLFL
jgi:hypothetical protein